MTRGAQKIQAQAKNQEKKNAAKGGNSTLKDQALGTGLKYQCPICKIKMQGYNTLLQHYEAKHPKETPPPDTVTAN